MDVFGGAGLRVIHPPRWSVVKFCLSWAAILVCCLLIWAVAISVLV